MGLFSKNKKEEEKTNVNQKDSLELPELPELPSLPELQEKRESEQKERISKLPSFPQSYPNSKMNRDILKQVIDDYEIQKKNQFPVERQIQRLPKESLVQEEDDEEDNFLESTLQIQPKSYQMNVSPQKKMELEIGALNKRGDPNEEPLFIRIDKYKSAIEKIQESKHKLMEIEKVLADIKDLRTKEEFELQEWEKQIQNAKSRIDSADKILFSQIG